MSQRAIKKMKQTARREMRQYLTEFKDYLKPKPKAMPWWLWKWMQRKVLKMEKITPHI